MSFEIGNLVFNANNNLFGVVAGVTDATNRQPVQARQDVVVQTAVNGVQRFVTTDPHGWELVRTGTDVADAAVALLAINTRALIVANSTNAELRMAGYAKDRALDQFKESVADAFADTDDDDVWEILSDLGIESEVEVDVRFSGSMTVTVRRCERNDESALRDAIVSEGVSTYDIDDVSAN